MKSEEKIAALANLFEVDESDIVGDKKLMDLNWDSMTMLGLMAILKSSCQKIVGPAELRALQTVQDVFDLMD